MVGYCTKERMEKYRILFCLESHKTETKLCSLEEVLEQLYFYLDKSKNHDFNLIVMEVCEDEGTVLIIGDKHGLRIISKKLQDFFPSTFLLLRDLEFHYKKLSNVFLKKGTEFQNMNGRKYMVHYNSGTQHLLYYHSIKPYACQTIIVSGLASYEISIKGSNKPLCQAMCWDCGRYFGSDVSPEACMEFMN